MKDYSKLSPAQFEAQVQGLRVVLNLNPDIVIAVDAKGKAFQVTTVPASKQVKRHLFSPKCVDLCGYELRRPHLCCWSGACRLPRVKAGKLPAVIPVDVYFLGIHTTRKHAWLKRWLLKKVLSIAEILAN